jgi:acyl-[acyl-carrier-protein]-phospholipid O-acyltransferase/long-chain-fatty-acid--[acyl-carrier-protein] ligase
MNQKNSSGFAGLIRNGGFQAFLWTQFLGALNDNLYKIALSLRAVHVAAEHGAAYISLAGAVFVAPFLMFSGYSGHLADRFSKRRVMIAVKVFEIAAMAAGLATFFTENLAWMLVVLFMMALHSTIFSPAKYGYVPELLPEEDLSRANALLEMTTFVAIVLGTALSSVLSTYWAGELWKLGAAMLAVAATGFVVSLRITPTPAAAAVQPFRWNPFAEVITGTKHLLRDPPLWLTVIGISYFWLLGALFQLDLFLYGSEVLRVGDVGTGLMVTCLAIGIGVGSMLAGRISGDRVDLGLVPIGSILLGLLSLGLASQRGSYAGSCVVLALLGVAGGLYIVPLNALLQQRSERGEKGRIIATNNFYNTIGLMLASGTLWVLHDKLHFGADKLILLAGVATLIGTVYILSLLPDHFWRLVIRVVMKFLFRIRVSGQHRIPKTGPALLVANHISFVDGLVVNEAAPRNVRFMIWKPYYEHRAFHWLLRLAKAIPVGTSGPRDMLAAIAAAREQIKQGHVVCIFAEGGITRTGHVQPFKRGLERIVQGLDVPVIPVYMDRLWGSIFSFAGGKLFAGFPHVPYPVTVKFGDPVPAGASAQDVYRAVLELGTETVPLRKQASDTLPARLVRSARKNWGKFAMADSTGRELTYGKTLTASLLVSDWVRQNSAAGEKIGLLLPSSAGGAMANLGVAMAGRVAVNLNFTAGKEAFASAIEQCGIRTILSSRVFIEKAKLEPLLEGGPRVVDMAEVFAGIGKAAKLGALLRARLAPASTLLPAVAPDDVAAILFSSGSTSTPKGVMLSHYNIISNIESLMQVYSLTPHDRVMGLLPFFHSFGYTVTLWLPLLEGCGAVYHPNPTDAKTIGELVEKYRGTMLLTTPTFALGYVRKCTREQFASLRFVLVGAEKLRESVAKAFAETFGVQMFEGYGCTEMSPVVSVNTPNFEAGRDSQFGNKAGTVGRLLPGIAAKIVDVESGAPVPAGREGLLLVNGPNRMLGYLGQPEKTREALRDGWYNTGDIAVLDEDGFLRITDRLARFSKIGGEMVPHVKIEDAVRDATGGEPCCVVGVPDARKGERIAVLYTASDVTPEELWRRLSRTDLPKLWVPKRESICKVDAIPTLGTGKIDLRGARAHAEALAEG